MTYLLSNKKIYKNTLLILKRLIYITNQCILALRPSLGWNQGLYRNRGDIRCVFQSHSSFPFRISFMYHAQYICATQVIANPNVGISDYGFPFTEIEEGDSGSSAGRPTGSTTPLEDVCGDSHSSRIR